MIDTSLSQQFLSAEEKRAVAVAKAYLERDLGADIDGYFSISTAPAHYFVLMNYFFFDDNGERWVPSGFHTGVYVSHEFKVIGISPGL